MAEESENKPESEGEKAPEEQPDSIENITGADAKPEEKKEELSEHKIKLDIIKKILDDDKKEGEIQIEENKGGPEGSEGAGENKDIDKKEIIKWTSIITGILIGVIFILLIGARLLHNPLDDLEKKDTDIQMEEPEENRVKETDIKGIEEEDEDIKKAVDKDDKYKEEKEIDEGSKSDKGFFGEITGFVINFLKEHIEENLEAEAVSEENKTEEIDEDTKELAEIKDKLLEGIIG